MPIPKTAELLKPLEEKLDKIIEKLEVLETKLNECPKETVIGTATVQTEATLSNLTTKFPVPLEYLELAHSMLNSRFGVTIDPEPNTPMFRFTIVVPREYSSLSDAEFESVKADLRPKMLNYSDGVPGVRTWVETVWNNFNPELKAKIKADQMSDGH